MVTVFYRLLFVKFRYAWGKVFTMVPCRKIQLIIIAETVLIPHGGKPRTHDLKSWIDLFDESRIV